MNQDSQQGGAEFRPAVSSLVSTILADGPYISNFQSVDLPSLVIHDPGIEQVKQQKWTTDAACKSALDVSSDGLTSVSQMALSDFIERRFAPEHIDLKRYPSRLFYQAILKHVIRPDEVERIFKMNSRDPRKRLKALERWPYLDQLRLSEIRHDHVSQILSAALAEGYSEATVRHIRNVIGTIFSYAIEKRYFAGENPIRSVKPTQRITREGNTLTSGDARRALDLMRYPERELTLIGAMTSMSPAEIFGLQWKYVNMTGNAAVQNEIRISPMTIAVRKRWYRGHLDNVRRVAVRDIAIDQRLHSILAGLKDESHFNGPDDHVLVSQVGTPVNYDNIMAKRLRPIAKQLGVQSVTSRAFRHLQGLLNDQN